jgi:hypothetical protein
MTTPTPQPDDALARPRAAADLTGVPLPRLLSLVTSGVVRSERIKGEAFVSLVEVERAAIEGARGGDRP